MATNTTSAITTILWGLLTTAILFVAFFVVALFFLPGLPGWFNLTICILFPLIVFLSGLATIDPNHTGLLNVFGTRSDTVINEGYVWLPPFTSVTIFDTKVQITELSEFELNTDNQIPVKIKTSFNWCIVDNYAASKFGMYALDNSLSALVKNEVRSELLEKELDDIKVIKSNKYFIQRVIDECNATAEYTWGVQITHLFISTVVPSTASRAKYFESKAEIDEVAATAARIAKTLDITPVEALDKYSRERHKVTSIEHIYSARDITKILSLIDKLMRK